MFWARGYDGRSLTDLTGAMGITKSSMYAAFGDKEQLFRKAVKRYAEGPASYATRALRERHEGRPRRSSAEPSGPRQRPAPRPAACPSRAHWR
ncbi:TetR/AcrR family transcriptional regulator [Amycolatopsis sp. lyj-23]|uniref:TetR/AcrR family transcriptional regulator n=1 Tax=Amycolatopsis sp. lyj-23 TaxID=2789283 RepID=UPI00397B04AD